MVARRTWNAPPDGASPVGGQGPDRRGAYGLCLGSLPAGDLVAAGSGWEPWHVAWEALAPCADRTQRFDEAEALLNVEPAGQAHLDRRGRTTTLRLARPPAREALVHPHLASTAVVTARWFDRQAFHAGAFVLEDGVWAVLGEREQGKSSALAWLAHAGFGVFADDVLVLDGDRALAGPRCLDLREEAAGHFGIGCDIGVVGSRRRWRVGLGAVPPELPFRGWVVLRWSDTVGLRPVPLAERLPVLLAGRGLRLPEADPRPWLPLVARPMVVLGRPRDWTAADTAMGVLLEGLGRLAD